MAQNTPSNDVEKRLKLMRYWLVGIFLIVFAAATTVYWMWLFPMAGAGAAIGAVWPIWLIAAVLCAAVYFGYKALIGRK
jgi:hypothetical protein